MPIRKRKVILTLVLFSLATNSKSRRKIRNSTDDYLIYTNVISICCGARKYYNAAVCEAQEEKDLQ